MTISLVLADAHPLLLDGLQALLATQPDLQVLARCTDGAAALQAMRTHRPDLLVLDLALPKRGGLALLRELKACALPTQAVVLTAAVRSEEVIDAVRLGVRGVVLKEMAPEMVLRCLRKVHAGGVWLERGATAHAIETLMRRDEGERELSRRLTAREIEVARCVAQGLSNKEIARRLAIHEGTVKVHLHNVYAKLSVASRLALSTYLRERSIAVD